jgi:phage shock protein PspC (stress-responsive transcriptional regulator)
MAQEPSGPEQQPAPEPPRRRLKKSANDKVLFGVAGGIAEYLDIDPILVRVGFIALLFAGGTSLIVYIVLALVMPGPDDEPSGDGAGLDLRGSPTQVVGIVIVVVGVLLLLGNLGLLDEFPWEITWPAAIIAIGLLIIFAKARK